MSKKKNKDVITLTRVNTKAVTRTADSTDELYAGKNTEVEVTSMWYDEVSKEVCIRAGNGKIIAFSFDDFKHLSQTVISHGYYSRNPGGQDF